MNEKQKEVFTRRICPNTEAIKDWWVLKNGYSNSEVRKSFNVQASLCDQNIDPTCATKDEIDFLLQRLQFTVYLIEDYVQFGNVGDIPFLTVNKFHSQF